ncbi:MAG: LytTR family DNA-binding domain-containing protein [Defluviitaleaceae bacterium]|nr:LytTR family DNA-binding domain-containing protein [Defluviitaleaceae bacterium]
MIVKIAVCDDEIAIGSQVEGFLAQISDKINIKFDVDVYFTGEGLCEGLASGVCYDLIFLDIELSRVAASGIEVGSMIRDVFGDNIVSIVYISWQQKYSMQLFDTRPLNFLIKPLTYEKIEQAVSAHLKVAGLSAGSFGYKIGHTFYKVRVRDIVYLESAGREVIVHMVDGSRDRFYGGLKKSYDLQLARYGFLPIHASYVVNYDHVAVFEYERLVLTNGTALPISQARRKEIREAYYAALEGGRR